MTTFSCKGNLGDIIYSLASVKAYAEIHWPVRYLLVYDAPSYTPDHPFGNVAMTLQAANMLKPLLQMQDYIKEVEVVRHNEVDHASIDFCLDDFRDLPEIDYWRGNIPEWFIHLFRKYYNIDIHPDLTKPWLSVPKKYLHFNNSEKKIHIYFSRSARYQNKIDLKAMRGKFNSENKPYFIGLPSENAEFVYSTLIDNHIACYDFAQIAFYISKCKYFFGNQTFFYSIAEALKVPRFLEVSPTCPNVQPIGNNAFKIQNQKDFEIMISKMTNS
ncbi:MAG TPA: hypothetical protein DCQ93_03980 [Bacteroidetes bacterium]|nr:hypothetical protein [Bacteroidota bacterium]